MSDLAHYLEPVDPFLRHYGYAAVFLGVFFESLGLPLPGESLVIASALLAVRGEFQIAPLLGAVWSATFFGNSLGYLLGLFSGRQLTVRHGKRFGLTESRLAKVEGFFARFGPEVVLFGRFLVPLRQLNGLIAGALAMPWRRFLLYNAVGAALWTAVWSLGVYAVGHDIANVLAPIHRFGAMATAAGIGVLAVVAIGLWRKYH